MKIRQFSSRYDVEQGFEEPEGHSVIQLPYMNNVIPQYSSISNKQLQKNRTSSKKQQAKLKFISIQRQNSTSSHYQSLKNQQQKLIHQSLTLQKDQLILKKRKKLHTNKSKTTQLDYLKQCVIQNKRTQIGDNLILKQYNSIQVKMIKQHLLNKGGQLVFQDKRQLNSHAMFKRLLKLRNANDFLKNKYNKTLLQKVTESNINLKFNLQEKISGLLNKKMSLQFVSDFQSANLDFVTQINPYEYDLYLKADTNTLGHQNWFYFKVFNHFQERKNIFMNICNLKRSFKLVKKGQKIFKRFRKINNELKTSIEKQDEQWTKWQKIQQDITINLNQDLNLQNSNDGKSKKIYKLSFASTLQPEFQYQFSLLPPYTYSELLGQIQKIQSKCQYACVEILTFSLIGVAIPMITFTRNSQFRQKKKVILISARIHPGETCASFVMHGLLKRLSEQSPQLNLFLQKNIIKVIPMLNPDGVILGNFRTNYLGNDLNRSFNKDSESLFPQIVALKQLGTKLKSQFGQRFVCFLDLHGHSSQKNIFTYGPQYDTNHKQYTSSRFIPKVLQNLTDYFNYNKCTFKLQECKFNTARGFFLSKLKVMAFTIQSSYALYDSIKDEKQFNLDLKVENLVEFGGSIVKGLELWMKFFNNDKLNLTNQMNMQNCSSKDSQNQVVLINKIKKQLKIQSAIIKKKTRIIKNPQHQEDDDGQDSDGQSESEDIPMKQRQKLERRFIERNAGLFPRILRPAIIHPEVTPPVPIFSVSKIGSSTVQKSSMLNASIINARIRRKKLNSVRPGNANNAYTEYLLKQVKGLEFLKPSIDRMKIERKQSSIIASLSQMSK